MNRQDVVVEVLPVVVVMCWYYLVPDLVECGVGFWPIKDQNGAQYLNLELMNKSSDDKQ